MEKSIRSLDQNERNLLKVLMFNRYLDSTLRVSLDMTDSLASLFTLPVCNYWYNCKLFLATLPNSADGPDVLGARLMSPRLLHPAVATPSTDTSRASYHARAATKPAPGRSDPLYNHLQGTLPRPSGNKTRTRAQRPPLQPSSRHISKPELLQQRNSGKTKG